MAPTVNYEHPDPECDLDYVPNKSRKAEVRYALANSFGFGGTNGALLMKVFEE
jgi:3-oxoacyl-[acyl-carrier-protein] synthase II